MEFDKEHRKYICEDIHAQIYLRKKKYILL